MTQVVSHDAAGRQMQREMRHEALASLLLVLKQSSPASFS
jgi:hypothetical protein